ncbi:DUF485 domain-containing protein [Ureibacillus terrenus]|uniref:DUF485 domain-containing protein n=1 Tax=Ureibacillus terrenus TaxID=118246 RepID=A0A540V130_9BACL|nr:DUF485 domain-containing protein [Ureibacillus terrenus]MED3662968.1 DUF485 domain-containing protein [Ureibacillus terrenus]MED3765095.1 DUF485 domain-containing protein [Ureibacillus terrenus]TQE90470.1 DUF485 domain-containing protein [Ureibacillus terrenus]
MEKKGGKPIDYEKIAKMESFRQLSRKKNAFLWTMTVIFFVLYMLLPVLTSYTKILHQKAIGEITWVWFYSFGLFIMVWGLAHFYVGRANKFDKEAKEIIEEYERGAGQ